MSSPKSQKRSFLSLDTWAVLLSLVLALFVRFGIIKSITW